MCLHLLVTEKDAALHLLIPANVVKCRCVDLRQLKHGCCLLHSKLLVQNWCCVCRKELDKLLPEEFRRFDVADKSYVKSQAGSYLAQAAQEPPPRRITVMEPPVDHRADPVTGYAKLGYAGQVRHLPTAVISSAAKQPEKAQSSQYHAFGDCSLVKALATLLVLCPCTLTPAHLQPCSCISSDSQYCAVHV